LYLTEDVSISPNSRFELNILGKNKLFVEGEESVVPRWVALLLKKYNLAKIKDEPSDILNSALTLISKQSKSEGLEKPENAIVKLKFQISEEKLDRHKLNLLAVLKELVDMRIPKVFNKLIRKGEEDISDLDPIEMTLYLELKKLFSEWYDSVFKAKLEQII